MVLYGLRVLFALLSDIKMSYDLVRWSRGTPTTKGLIFVPEGSAIRTHDDMVCVEAVDSERGFASDDSGGLFAFSMRDGTFQEIDRDKGSRIRNLLLVRW